MKKSALLILAAIFVIGIQSCSTDLQEEISPENFSTTKDIIEKNNFPGFSDCFKTIYIDYGNMGLGNRADFKELAAEKWFDYNVLIKITNCPSVEAWTVPCELIDQYRNSTRNDEEKEIVIDAEESLTLGEGGAPPPPSVTGHPRYKPDSSFNYNICVTGIEDIIEDDDNVGDNPPAPTPDDDNPHNTLGLPVRNIR